MVKVKPMTNDNLRSLKLAGLFVLVDITFALLHPVANV